MCLGSCSHKRCACTPPPGVSQNSAATPGLSLMRSSRQVSMCTPAVVARASSDGAPGHSCFLGLGSSLPFRRILPADWLCAPCCLGSAPCSRQCLSARLLIIWLAQKAASILDPVTCWVDLGASFNGSWFTLYLGSCNHARCDYLALPGLSQNCAVKFCAELLTNLSVICPAAHRGSNTVVGHSCLLGRMLPCGHVHPFALVPSCAPHCLSAHSVFFGLQWSWRDFMFASILY